MDKINDKFGAILTKYAADIECWPADKLDEIACLAVGLLGALQGARMLGKDDRTQLLAMLSVFSVVFEMGKRSSHGIELHVESEPFGSYKESDQDGTHYGIELLTPSQVDVRNHINEVAGLERRWVPA